MYGEMVPEGGGDLIPLLKNSLLVGRRESCDIVLRFSNVSAHHCQLTLNNGYWFVKDLHSRNGVKVNGIRVTDKRLDPGDVLSVAKHKYKLNYSPVDNGAFGPPPPDVDESEIFKHSLLERAGLEKSQPVPQSDRVDLLEEMRFDLQDDSAEQIRRGRQRPT